MRLKVVGVSRCLRLPREVVRFTSADEFHSEKNTEYFCAISHL